MPRLTLSYDHLANGFECHLPDRVVRAPLPPSFPLDDVSAGAVGSQNGSTIRLAYSSPAPDGGKVLVIVHVDARTGQIADAPAVSDTIDDELANAFLEAAAHTVNPAGALRDLLEFRSEL